MGLAFCSISQSKHESPDVVVVFAKTSPSPSSQRDPVPGVDLVSVLAASLRGEGPALHRLLCQRGRHCGL